MINDGILYLFSNSNQSIILILTQISAIVLNPPQTQSNKKNIDKIMNIDIYCGGIIHKLAFDNIQLGNNMHSVIINSIKDLKNK